jgi:HEPN domain-containing protein
MGQTRREFQQLARMRLKDASVLMQRGNVEGAYYLTGLAGECAVKACIARNTNRHDFPPSPNAVKDIYTHDLVKLVGAAKLQATLDAEIRVNSSLNKNWAVVKDWNINSRYLTKGLNARDLYRAVAGRDGVMQWLRQRW